MRVVELLLCLLFCAMFVLWSLASIHELEIEIDDAKAALEECRRSK